MVNRTRLALAGAAAALLAVALLPTSAVGAGGARSGSDRFTADPSALTGHGELAVVSGHRLHLVGGAAGGSRHVVLPGQVAKPMWSFDHSTVAVTVTRSGRSAVWIASASGTTTMRLTVPTAGLGQIAWAPTADVLAVQTTTGHGSQRKDVVESITTGGTVTTLATAPTISGFAWSPDGQQLALAADRFHDGWTSKLEVVPAAGGDGTVIAHESGSVFDVAGWWPDGSGVLVWQDPQGSASLAADGVHLLDITAAGGHRDRLPGVMLEYPQWIADRSAVNEIAYVLGGDREIAADHKHVEICGLAACHAVKQASDVITVDPTWATPGGHLAVVRDRAVSPRGTGPAYARAVQNSGTVLVRRPSGFHPAGVGAGATAPTWAAGGALLVVKHDALWLRAGGRATRVAGPLTVPANYYGFLPWSDSYAWTKAVVQ